MRALIVGNSARDHALAWKIAQSPLLTELHVTPASVAMEQVATCHDVDVFDFEGLVELALQLEIDLAIVAFEDLLVGGLADRFELAGVACVGPGAAGAQIEGSKLFSKQIMDQAGIPTAKWELFADAEPARAAVRAVDGPIVVKADGLAGGKGAFVCGSVDEAVAAIDAVLVDEQFGPGQEVVVEELLVGDEASALFLTDGITAIPLPLAQDYKRLGDDDAGPNTGGMGACVPPPASAGMVDPDEVLRVAVLPLLAALRARGIRYHGVLYVGTMQTADGLRVLEYNCRFGNPETQALVRCLDHQTDLLALLDHTARGTLADAVIPTTSVASVAICLAAPSYPDRDLEPALFAVDGIGAASAQPHVEVFVGPSGPGSSATGMLYGRGGRVCAVTATGPSLQVAAERAYAAARRISFDGMHFRGDIGRPPAVASAALR